MSDSSTSFVPDIKLVEMTPETEKEHEEPEELSVVLLRTVNHVFSRDYMSHDPTFVAHLETRNNEYYASINLVAELPIIKALTSDVELLKQALQSSDQVVFDEETQSAHPIFKLVQRTTLILRDFPSSVTPEEVKTLFSEDEKLFASIVEAKSEVGDNYFVRFENEEVTMNAWNFIRNRKRDGKPIQARIKSESILKNSYFVDPAVMQYQQQQQGGNLYSNTFWDQRQGYNPNYRGGRSGGGRYGGNNSGAGNNNRRRNNNSGSNNANNKQDYRRPGGRNNTPGANNNPGGRRSSYTERKEGGSKAPNAPLHVTSHWPPLHQGEHQSGYRKHFQKYNREQVVAIVSASTPVTPTWEPQVASIQHIFNDTPVTQMEILRPIQDARVDFIEGKRKHRKSKSGAAAAKVASDNKTDNKEKKPIEAPTPATTVEGKTTEEAKSTPYADAAKVATNGSN